MDVLTGVLYDPTSANKDACFAQIGALLSQADAYDPVPYQNEMLTCHWNKAQELERIYGYTKNMHCPVVAIHGDYDLHAAAGIATPLATVLKDFRFLLLQHGGHYPWYEKEAKEPFYALLKQELH